MADKPILERNFNDNIDLERKLKEGAILSRLFIEVQSNDLESAKKALEKTVFQSLANEKNVHLLNVKFYEIKKSDEGVFSGVIEIKSLFRDFRWFVNVVMRYGPSAIEIIKPEEYKLSLEEMQSLISDVSEISQTLASHIIAMLKDNERRALYIKSLSEEKK